MVSSHPCSYLAPPNLALCNTQRADAAEQRVEAAEQRAQALEGQVSTVVETNAHLQKEQQSQRDELSSLHQAQSGEVARLVREQLDHQMVELIARIHSGASVPILEFKPFIG
ncbi:unnamed protein product [Miscanthus lutarioriparius]|uniref:Uncharacterized protein n=1 Tax=Miscanthus lutarioriparius TaxID=422564 RepID=A0A811PVT1_9POAL|nr:unnamed protein product [Miscanthus lutarioriparius]